LLKKRIVHAAVLLPIDLRHEHYENTLPDSLDRLPYGSFVATEAPVIIRERIGTTNGSKLFTRVSRVPSEPSDIVIRSEIHAFCSQAVGLFVRLLDQRIEGYCGAQWAALFQHKFERVVTDGDPQYSGSQVGFIEQAMTTIWPIASASS